ncbi:hypothetical protein ACS91_26690, partial [Vibrio parahaemolyticus]|uniref:hypothetical protein n=1 Tax=Vibrio parahaemolyticus TaxID=670 RepID=UPI0006C40805
HQKRRIYPSFYIDLLYYLCIIKSFLRKQPQHVLTRLGIGLPASGFCRHRKMIGKQAFTLHHMILPLNFCDCEKTDSAIINNKG